MCETLLSKIYAHVTCNFSMDCVLPCQFKPADVEAIQWYRQNALIHSFLNGSEMLDQQNERYRGRTSLFLGEFTQGNASLLLKHSDIHDRGRYKCHVRTALGDQESVVITKVEAPIRSLTLHMTGPGRYEEVMCSSQNIYPAPQLTFKLHNFSLTWTFTKANKTTVILIFDSLSHQTSNLWENQARVDPDQVLSGNGSLQLQNLDSSAQTGTYSCAFSASNIQHLVHNHISFTAAATDSNIEVACPFSEDYILPCTFEPCSNEVIYRKVKSSISVHSFNKQEDHLGDQEKQYSSRTSLFKAQISQGKASLQLKSAIIQGQGKSEDGLRGGRATQELTQRAKSH
ncbi:hypothetical protein JZ751_022661 [Albula glossodonta]|uniref:Ig-like domain-containing protein n=1 Tax=Albula glossodonta TaxID=121402 RepID=A0A8T2PJR0_9TELE|nr:hypothetical protein JZ751_022661 [Albula glossodonta]